MDDAAGGFLAILCQFGIAIAAPIAITITTMAIPCAMRLPVVLMMWFSSSVVIVFFTYCKWILHVRMLTTSAALFTRLTIIIMYEGPTRNAPIVAS